MTKRPDNDTASLFLIHPTRDAKVAKEALMSLLVNLSLEESARATIMSDVLVRLLFDTLEGKERTRMLEEIEERCVRASQEAPESVRLIAAADMERPADKLYQWLVDNNWLRE